MANTFNVGDTVRTTDKSKAGGKVKYIACSLATTAGGKICNRKTCAHNLKDFVWVVWQDKSVYSYHHSELELDVSNAKAIVPAPVITINDPNKIDNKEDLAALKKLLDDKEKIKGFFKEYNGFSDQKSKKIIKNKEATAIPSEEIDWDVYNGFKRGPLRKQI